MKKQLNKHNVKTNLFNKKYIKNLLKLDLNSFIDVTKVFVH